MTVNKREVLKRTLLEERAFGYCEAKKFWPHDCEGGLDLHEVILKRNDAPKGKQEYIFDARNCVLVCHRLHMEEGQTEQFNIAAVAYLHRFYPHDVMQEYLHAAPFKVKPPQFSP